MVELDSRVDDYIAQAQPFAQPILTAIRAAFHAGCPDLVEQIKWGVPSFERKGMLGGMAAFQQHVSFGFWRAPEMDDPDGLLGAVRKASPMRIRFESVEEMPAKRVLVGYVRQARKLDDQPKPAKAKAKAKKPAPRALAWLTKAIQANKKAAATWKTFPPSCKREYIEWVTEAKREATRQKRLVQTVEWLAEGKRRNWEYENC